MSPPPQRTNTAARPFPWKAWLGLVAIVVATAMNWTWFWGFYFVALTVPTLFTGQTSLFEPVDRRDTPVLFWLVTVAWLFIGGWMIWYAVAPYVTA